MPQYNAPLRVTKPGAWSRDYLKARWQQLRNQMDQNNYTNQMDIAEFERIDKHLTQ